MHGADRHVIEQNVWDFISRFVHAQEPEGRLTIARMMRNEEDKFAKGVERYEIVQRWIENATG